MTILSNFQNGATDIINSFGQMVSIKYYNINYNQDYYDDDISLTQSGNILWTSGAILPILNSRGSSDAVLLEQGKILTNDTKLYIAGDVPTSGTIKIGLGSPTASDNFSLLDTGVTKWDVSDASVLKKLYIRRLTNGSLIGE